MKKLRMFDSLKFIVAAIVCTFILNVAHADTTAIQSVIAYGKTEQNGTPTPTAPVPIMTNNGVLKYRFGKNLFDVNNPYKSGYAITQNGSETSVPSFSIYSLKVEPLTTYTYSCNYTESVTTRIHSYDKNGNWIQQDTYGNANATKTFTTTSNTAEIRISINNTAALSAQLELGSTATAYEPYSGPNGIYADGLTETIRDSAGHTATAQMLLGLNDTYRDEQNITTGAITRKVGVKVLDGTEDWIANTTYGADVFMASGFLPNSLRISASSGSILFSTHFAPAPISGAASNPKVNNTMSINSEYHAAGLVWIRSNNFSTVAQFKAWLAEQYANGTPVIVVYPLKTETTESVATKTLTTAPVRQTAGSILGMPIEVVLGDGTREWVRDMITIATTRYNEEQFEPVQNELSNAMNVVDDVVTRTMTQAQAIDTIATTKQTRPDEGCMAKYCLLVEDEDGTPHWYPIAGANGVEYVLPAGYTQLTYIQSDGRQMINTGYVLQETDSVEVDYKLTDLTRTGDKFILGAQPVTGASNGGFWVETYDVNNTWYIRYGSNSSANTYGSVTPTSQLSGTLAVSKNSFVVNGVEILNPNFVSMPVNPMTIFNRISLDGSIANYGASAQISEVRVKNGNNIVRRYIAVRNSNNEIGMYDTVRGQFFTNAGTGTFTAGPDM